MVRSFVIARSENDVIGCETGLPWSLRTDLKIFRLLTLGHPIIMGRRTFESINRPLDQRENIVEVQAHVEGNAHFGKDFSGWLEKTRIQFARSEMDQFSFTFRVLANPTSDLGRSLDRRVATTLKRLPLAA
jgi:hypothetical protein